MFLFINNFDWRVGGWFKTEEEQRKLFNYLHCVDLMNTFQFLYGS